MTTENEELNNSFEDKELSTLKPTLIPPSKAVKKSGNKWNRFADARFFDTAFKEMNKDVFELDGPSKPDAEWNESMKPPVSPSPKPDAEWDESMKPPVAPSPKSQVLKKIKEEMFKLESVKFKTDPLGDNAEEMPLPNEDDIELIRKSLVIQRSSERLRIIAIVTDLEDHRSNELSSVRCGGDPLGCYAYNTVTDTYYITCMTYQDLGPISVSYRLQTAIGVESYSNNLIALPDEVVEKYLSPSQKKNLKLLRERYKSPKYSIHFMQSILC